MQKVHTLMGKLAAAAMLPALAFGLFAAPVLANGDETNVNVVNVNKASLTNIVASTANTGNNDADGGDAGDGGHAIAVAGLTGDGGEGGEGDEGGNGGDADVDGDGFALGGDGAKGGNGGDGARGGDAGALGNGGKGGNGGNGGGIATGDAYAGSTVVNDVNYNKTNVDVEDCGCADRYNEFSLEKDFSLESNEWESYWSKNWFGKKGGEESDEFSLSKSFDLYYKTYVPIKTNVNVVNVNDADVDNVVVSASDTGDNDVDGGDAGDGGSSIVLAGATGNGGDGEEGDEGGNGGDADVEGDNNFFWWNHDDGEGTAIAGDGAKGGNGGDGARGGDAGAEGNAGNGGNGGEGGVVVTGYAQSDNDVVNVVNHNVTRVRN